jgi:hypothetical protein
MRIKCQLGKMKKRRHLEDPNRDESLILRSMMKRGPKVWSGFSRLTRGSGSYVYGNEPPGIESGEFLDYLSDCQFRKVSLLQVINGFITRWFQSTGRRLKSNRLVQPATGRFEYGLEVFLRPSRQVQPPPVHRCPQCCPLHVIIIRRP